MATIRTIGAQGQITLGKKYAGRAVTIDEIEAGVWRIKLGDFIPRSERWLHEPQASELLDRAIAWAESHPPEETSLDELESRLRDGTPFADGNG